MQQLYSTSTNINQLRQAIYVHCGVAHYSKGYRPKKLRQVCRAAVGLDLRRKSDVVLLAQRLGIVQSNVIHVDFGKAA